MRAVELVPSTYVLRHLKSRLAMFFMEYTNMGVSQFNNCILQSGLNLFSNSYKSFMVENIYI